MSEYKPIYEPPHMSEGLERPPQRTPNYFRGIEVTSIAKRIGMGAAGYVAPAVVLYGLIVGLLFSGYRSAGVMVWEVVSVVVLAMLSGINPWRYDVIRSMFSATMVRTVFDHTGRPVFVEVSLAWRTVRFLCHFLDFFMWLPIGLIFVAVRKDRRCIADLIACTAVVNQAADTLSLGSPEVFRHSNRRDYGEASVV